MLGSMSKKRNQEDERSLLNKETSTNDPAIDKGFELMIRNKNRREEPPKTLSMKFGSMFTLRGREWGFVFDLGFIFNRKT